MSQVDLKPYRSKDWRTFRAEVIRMDDGACKRCGRGQDDGVSLHVHHTQYIKDKKPWEYPYHLCETLCSGCHAEEHGIFPPQSGWEYMGWEDLGDLVGACDRCATAIRYVFLVSHPSWGPMEVGEQCCDKLTSSVVASDFLQERQRKSDKLKRFVSSSRWKTYPDGSHRITQARLGIRVTPVDGAWSLVLEGVKGRKRYATATEAKEHVHRLIDSGEAQRFLSGHKRANKGKMRGHGGDSIYTRTYVTGSV